MINLLVSLDGISHCLFEEIKGRCEYTGKLKTENPSVTFPVHMSVLTGNKTEKHGIFDNVTFLQYPYKRTELYFLEENKALAIVGDRTLVHLLEEQGVACKLIHWPLGNGFVCKAVCKQAIVHDGSQGIIDAKKSDAQAFEELFQTLKNWDQNKHGFVAVHFTQYDAAAHIYGVEHPETKEALEQMLFYMERIQKLRKIYNVDKIIFFSDHGIIDRTDTFYPHLYIAGKREINDQFRFLCDGSGSAMYYSILPVEEDNKLLKEIQASAKVESIKLVPNERANPCSPKAIINMKRGVCAEDILPGATPCYGKMKGVHGYDSAYVEEMDGFLFIEEEHKRIISNKSLTIVDLAPTIAAWYGYTYLCDGRKI